MTDQEYFKHVSAALKVIIDAAARYMQKNPNAKYVDGDGKERPISFAIDIMRKHLGVLEDASKEDKTNG